MSFEEDYTAYINSFNEELQSVSDIQLLRKRITYLRWKVSENLEKLLFEFETNVRKTDNHVIWCPDSGSALDQLNKQIRSSSRVRFLKHNAVRHFVRELQSVVPDESEDVDTVVAGAKFIIANTGNIYLKLNDYSELETILKAKKLVVIAGIDSVLAQQSELVMCKQIYALYETGRLQYNSELLTRPGRIRGINAEVVLLLTDLNKSRLLELPVHRPLFSLLNYDLPPVCPQDRLNYDPSSWSHRNTLEFIQYAFMHDPFQNSGILEGNYGLNILNAYIPYDIDLYEQILDARSMLHQEEKPGLLSRLMDSEKHGMVFQPKKFRDGEKFKKFADRNFFGSS